MPDSRAAPGPQPRWVSPPPPAQSAWYYSTLDERDRDVRYRQRLVVWEQTIPCTAGANWGEWFTPGFEINVGPGVGGTIALTYEYGAAGTSSAVNLMAGPGHLRVTGDKGSPGDPAPGLRPVLPEGREGLSRHDLYGGRLLRPDHHHHPGTEPRQDRELLPGLGHHPERHGVLQLHLRGNCTWSTVGSKFPGANNANFATLFIGKATATGAANATLTLSGTSPGFECVAQQFSSTAGAWAQDGPQGTLDLVTGTATWPSLTPSGSGGLYFGFFFDSGTASAGSTSGYTYDLNTFGDGLAFNPNCTAAAQAPVWGDSGQVFGIAVLLRETPSGPSSHAVQAKVPRQEQFPAGLVYGSASLLDDLFSYSAGRISASYGIPPAPPPTAGPVFRQAETPVRSRIPGNAPRGRTASSPGALVSNPTSGPAFRQKTFPARIRITLPPRGRIGSNRGTVPRNPTPGPVFRQRTSIGPRYLNGVYVLGLPGLIYVDSREHTP